MNKLFIIVLSLASILLSVKALALEVNDLYRVVVEVEDQSLQQRKQATTKALKGVLLKVGGKESVLNNKLLKNAVKKPNNYISQYHYQRNTTALNITVKFDEDKVNALFKQAGLPIWGSLRPQVLLWLIDEQGAARHIVAYDENSLIPESVNNFSNLRGLPIVMPLMDLTDSEQVVLSDLWAYFPEKVQQVSSRYYADTVIVMRVSDSSLLEKTTLSQKDILRDTSCGILCVEQENKDTLALDWKVYTQNALYIQRYKGEDKVSLINQGLSDITALIYQSYALSSTSESDFVIEVKNINSLTSDMELFNFLKDLSGVDNVTLISAQADIRRFKLDLNSSQASFLAALSLNKKLSQQFEAPHTDLDDFDQNESIFDTQQYSQMKVIVLGEESPQESEVKQGDGNLPLITNPIQEQAESEAQDSVNEVTGVNGSDNSLETNSQTESLQAQTESDVVIEQNVPVFYWEKG